MSREVGQLYDVARAILRPIFAFSWKIEVEGLENIPEHGPGIVAPNHLSVIDHFVVGAALPRRITYVGKAEYMDSWKTRHIFPALGMIPIDRGGGSAADRALSAAAGLLEAGELFGIYPEGTRSRDGNLHKGHTGVARLALRTGAPIIPTGLQGTDVVQPADMPVPKLFEKMRVRFGRPIDVSRYRDRADDRLVLRQVTDEVMYEIRQLSGQDYVDTYANKKRSSQALPAPEAVLPSAPESGDSSTDEADAPRRSSADVLGARTT
jgi:1-acyl-sn-glycerol-3-phosphate acyltransferase